MALSTHQTGEMLLQKHFAQTSWPLVRWLHIVGTVKHMMLAIASASLAPEATTHCFDEERKDAGVTCDDAKTKQAAQHNRS